MVRSAQALLVAAAATLVIGAAGCGGGSESATGETTTASTTTTGTTMTPTTPPVTTVRIVVRDGKVVGGIQRATLEKGDKMTIVVTSDVDDEVHLHGYDRSAEVAPGEPARLVLVASLPGRFEVELEDRGLQIADLEVRP